ncbi:hypothetical protein ACU4GD_45090 [Cupriavidus basilensis]
MRGACMGGWFLGIADASGLPASCAAGSLADVQSRHRQSRRSGGFGGSGFDQFVGPRRSIAVLDEQALQRLPLLLGMRYRVRSSRTALPFAARDPFGRPAASDDRQHQIRIALAPADCRSDLDVA